jgi:hypothetical protein
MNKRKAAVVGWLAITICLVVGGQAYAGFTFLGPIPYRSAADSPFDLSGLGSTFFLEDFEDLVPQPGMSGDPILVGQPILEFVRQVATSVDGDDGQIDNSGFAGFSAGPIEIIDAGLTTEIVRFQFDVSELGFVPTAVGLVLTNGAGPMSLVTAFGADGSHSFIATNELMLSSAISSDDQFIGVLNPAGIFKIEFRKTGSALTGARIDHLQYGLLVPEPSGTLLVAMSGLVYWTWRIPPARAQR